MMIITVQLGGKVYYNHGFNLYGANEWSPPKKQYIESRKSQKHYAAFDLENALALGRGHADIR